MTTPEAIMRGSVILACVGGAIALALHGRDGWGWLLFIAFVALP